MSDKTADSKKAKNLARDRIIDILMNGCRYGAFVCAVIVLIIRYTQERMGTFWLILAFVLLIAAVVLAWVPRKSPMPKGKGGDSDESDGPRLRRR